MCVTETFLHVPNLPERPVTLAAVSGVYPQIPRALEQLGIRTVCTEPDPRLSPSVAHHADMQMFPIGDDRIFVLKNSMRLQEELQRNGFLVAETAAVPEAVYPKDVLCNALYLGETVFANLGTMDTMICAALDAVGIRTVHVKQGYAHCTTAILNEHAIVTMDSGIYAVAQFLQIDALFLEERNIKLEGHSYGFIGGCCGLIDKNRMAFTGKLSTLQCEKPLRAFLDKYGIAAVELTDGPMLDIGGILPLKQQA